MPARVRRARRSHEIMIPRPGGGSRNVNPGKPDEAFAEHERTSPDRFVWTSPVHQIRFPTI